MAESLTLQYHSLKLLLPSHLWNMHPSVHGTLLQSKQKQTTVLLCTSRTCALSERRCGEPRQQLLVNHVPLQRLLLLLCLPQPLLQ
jgi:hypothetical protein